MLVTEFYFAGSAVWAVMRQVRAGSLPQRSHSHTSTARFAMITSLTRIGCGRTRGGGSWTGRLTVLRHAAVGGTAG